MIPTRQTPVGYIKKHFKYNDAQIAALIEDLDLIPAIHITPTLIKLYRIELREKLTTMKTLKYNVDLLLGYTEEFLNSEYGRQRVQRWHDEFSLVLPINRSE